MKNIELIKQHNFDNTFVIGYYGGGNFGDELLLEVLQNLFYKERYKNIAFYYTNHDLYSQFHKDYGYEPVDPANKFKFLKRLLTSQNIVIGGGGIWGLDFNIKILILSILLFILRFVWGKTVYLMGIGYYNSTTTLGHIAAYIAGKSANAIIARDEESYRNFANININTHQDYDLSFTIPQTDHSDLAKEIKTLEHIINPNTQTFVVALRRFKKKFTNDYCTLVEDIIAHNVDKKFVLNIFEPESVDREGFAYLKRLEQKYTNVYAVFDFSFNPLSYYYFLKKYQNYIITIAPQFHSIITSYQAGVPFFPFVYDNKVEEVLKQMGISEYKWIQDLTSGDIQDFINHVQKK